MAETTQWTVIDHVCRFCYGRLLTRVNEKNETVVRCADCETEMIGRHESLCACGAKLRNGQIAGLKCQLNPSPTVEQPARVVVVFLGKAA